jgi:hypothetical protein
MEGANLVKGRKVRHVHHLKGQMGAIDNNIPFSPPLKPLCFDVEPHGYIDNLATKIVATNKNYKL